jgi:hypothetical protein
MRDMSTFNKSLALQRCPRGTIMTAVIPEAAMRLATVLMPNETP